MFKPTYSICSTSRVVIPLTKAKPDKDLPNNICPKLEIDGVNYYLLTHQVTTVSRSFLKRNAGTVLLNRTDIIIVAWVEIHQEELIADWQLALNGDQVFKIEPLK